MITKVYKQGNSAWSGLAYPKKPCTIGGSGCGEAAMANLLIASPKYNGTTPKTIYSYMKQFGSIVNGQCDGTKRAGEMTALAHYGFTDTHRVGLKDPITDLWKELRKGNRGALLVVKGRGGSKKTLWTTGVHYVAVRYYKEENGKHYLWIADSGWRNNDGWFSYEEHLRGAIDEAMVGKYPKLQGKAVSYRPTTPYTGVVPYKAADYGASGDHVKAIQQFLNWCLGRKLTVDGVFGVATSTAVIDFLETYGFTSYVGAFGASSIAKAKEIIDKHKEVTAEPPKPTEESKPVIKKEGYKGAFPNVYGAARLIAFAASQKGKYATRSNGGKDGKKYSNKFTKYFAGKGGINSKGQMPNVYGYIPGYCTLFACYCLVHIGEGHQVPFSTLNSKKAGYWWHAPSLMKYYKRQGKLVTDVKKAKPGAIAFKGSKSPTHTCIFVKYEKGYVYTWDGNVGGGVTYNKRKASVFCGFANLKYKDYFGKGTSGTDVLKWQRFLNWYFGKNVVAEDSVFGNATVKYTKEFQTAVGVTADGTVGMDTWKKAKAVQK